MHFVIYLVIAVVSFALGLAFGGKIDTDLAASRAELSSYVTQLEAAVTKERAALVADVTDVLNDIKKKL